jgi:ATP-binding cassette, subfamily B, bacterial PglK
MMILSKKLMSKQAQSKVSIRQLLSRIWIHLSQQRRRQLAAVMSLVLINSVTEVFTLGAILPFLTVVVAPAQIFKYSLITKIAALFGWTSGHQLVLPLTVIFAIASLLAGFTKLLLLWTNARLATKTGHEISMEVYRRTLYQPYLVHSSYNTSEIISAVGKANTVAEISNQVLTFVNALVMGIAIMVTFFLVQPLIATTAFLSFGFIYCLIIYITRRRLLHNSLIMSEQFTLRIKVLQEGLGGIRDVLLDSSQPLYCELYRQADRPFREAWENNKFLTSFPRYGVESLSIALIAGLAYGLSQQPGGGATALPLLGMLALGAQRLLPALQQIYSSWAFVRGNQGDILDILKLLEQPLPPSILWPVPEPLPWRSSIEFAAVSFRYGIDAPWVLQDLSFTIPKGTRVGFVGSTGSGKSTTIDLLMGLLDPSAGKILLDGKPLTGEYRRAWQQNIAHVPQHIYLADTTLAENIALGIPTHLIDKKLVERSAQQAKISKFIEAQPLGYDQRVGERGIRLSGGQRQRIGIARALYKQAGVLVFDEATSALDNITEREVMAAIKELDKNLTIILVAHRLTTVQSCDLIVELEQGRVVASGTYEELLAHSLSFQLMVKGGHDSPN